MLNLRASTSSFQPDVEFVPSVAVSSEQSAVLVLVAVNVFLAH